MSNRLLSYTPTCLFILSRDVSMDSCHQFKQITWHSIGSNCCHGNKALLCSYSSTQSRFPSQGHRACPNCGIVGTLAPLSATSAFVRCSNCRQFFINRSTVAAATFDDVAGERAAAAAAAARTLSNIIGSRRIPYPREIRAHLDQYVVGQESAKRLLSVQAYAHYRRLQHNLLGPDKPEDQLESQLTPLSKAADESKFLSALMQRQQMPVDGIKKFLSFRGILRAFGFERKQQPLQSPPQSARSPVRLSKSNVLLIGPSGSGKTQLVRALARSLRVPFAACSCAGLTQTGYSGEGVQSALAGLLSAAGGCPSRARTGVLFLDEIDKLASSASSGLAAAEVQGDVGGVGVQRDLLRLLDGAEVGVCTADSANTVQLDTNDILFVASGTFTGLSAIVRRREAKAGAATNTNREYLAISSDEEVSSALARMQPPDLVQFGLLPELVGRLPAVGLLASLRPAELARCLTEPRDSLARQYHSLLAADGCRLVLEPGAALAIGEAAARRGLGARGLRAIFEALLIKARFEAPGAGQASEVRLTANCCRVLGESGAGLPFLGNGPIRRDQDD
ncbi:hypothetical protein BOX15_Mlig024146g1 [Macrostomum lignano]|uniref:AAA domain-containing protein n=2 Tax=Macrostomum lignano TaxID=282301 RepID=A0A1I8I1L0_9PLAT|nr:hypothetical protein BOX15_Mlig024146g1 [Macrostomum lignano]